MVRGNHDDIYTTTKLVKDAGADMISFKCNIVGKHNIARAGVLDTAFEQIARAKHKHDFGDSPSFSIYSTHSQRDIEREPYVDWKCEAGCYYQHSLATIGSDGNLYLCDHNTMPGAILLVNVIDCSFCDVWNSKRRKHPAAGVEYTCQSTGCLPLGNQSNIFLAHITEL